MHARAVTTTLLLLLTPGVSAQEAPVPASAPETRPATQPASQATTTQAVQEQKREAEIKQELAEDTAREAESKLREIRAAQVEAKREARRAVFPQAAQKKLEQLESEKTYQELRKELSELRRRYAEELNREAELRQKLEARRDAVAATLAALDELTSEQRRQSADEFDSDAQEPQRQARRLRAAAHAEHAAVTEYQQRQAALAERLRVLESEAAPAQRGARTAQLRRVLDLTQQLVENQRLVAYALSDQAWFEQQIADEYRRGAEALRAANRRFWVQHAYLIDIAWILMVTVAITIGINLLAWLVARAAAAVAGRWGGEAAAVAGIKRVRTLVYFARSIAKLLVWVFAVVTILAEFGISPGQSAGALGVIGLVLAGMFQQLVVDFVKGIDIAAGGHYFIGDFIEVSGKAGHVLNITVKYTVLRTPSGQILNIPNSQCIPSRRFPAGYVDNYVDIPLVGGADADRARAVLADVGRQLNQRVEAVKREPEVVSSFPDGTATVIRARVCVLPTCDWVIKDHYIPAIKRRFEAENIPLAGEPTFFFINNVTTFRKLFSRELNEADIARVAGEETRPTLMRPDLPDPDAPPPPPDAEPAPRGPVAASRPDDPG